MSAAAASFALVPVASGDFSARGPLTFATARAARAAGLTLLGAAAAGATVIDCSGVTASDSAGLAVLLDWLAAAKLAGRSLKLTGLPPGLTGLARISETQGLLEQGV